jgi:hypothetical protein
MRRAALIGACILAGTTQSLAAEATAAEADRLVDVFHRYLGAPRAGEADHVRAVPEGEAYRLTIDFDRMAEAFLPQGFSVDAAELSFLAQPLPDATWRVSELTLPTPLTFSVPGQTLTYRWEGASFEGIYDPALASFVSFDHAISATSSEMRGVEGASTSFVGAQTIHGTTTGAGEDTVNTSVQQTVRDVVAQETITLPDAGAKASPALPIEFAYSIETAAIDLSLENLDAVGLLDLWAHAVARMQEDKPNVDEAALKLMLGELMPLFSRLDENIVIGGLRVGTPFGDFGMEEANIRMTLPGLVENGGMALSIALTDPSYPVELMPGWVSALAPTSLDFGFEISGFNLDAPARHLLTAFDGGRETPLENADLMAAAMMAVPPSGATLTLKPGRIDGPVLDIAYEGELSLSMPMPTGSFRVTATGVGDAIAALTANSADPMAMQALGLLSIAQMIGRETEDDAMEFVIELNPDGSVAVNGQIMTPPSGDPA